MISCLSTMSKSDEKKQLRGRFRFRAALSLLVFAGLMLLMLRAAQAQEAHLVKDINLSGSSNPQFLTDVNGTLYFSAADGVNGTELWKSDGTAAGTVMVEDINPGIGGSNPENLIQVTGVLYFSAADAVHGTELWNLGSNTIDTKDTGGNSHGCFIVTAGNAWSSTHDIKALRKSKESVLFTARGSKALAQLYHAWSPVMADFITTCNFVRTVLLLGLLLMSFNILICSKVVRGKSDPVLNHQERTGRGAYRLFHKSLQGKLPGNR